MSDSRRVRIVKNLTKRRRRDEFPLYPALYQAHRDQYVSLEYFLEHIND